MNSKPVAFITGASQGIGAATALEFAARGHHVALLARNRAALDDVAAGCEHIGAQTLVLAGDVGDLEFAEKSVAQIVEKWGRVDVLINNAAWRELISMRQISLESWEKTLRICLTAPAFLARWCASDMEKRQSGVILNVSSLNALQASGIAPAYAAAKGGLDALTYELAALYGFKGIRVVGVNLGAVDTEMSADYTSDDGENLSAEMRRQAHDMIPLRRFARPEEVAKMFAMLASPDASYIHGANILADGGWFHHHFSHPLKTRLAPSDFAGEKQ